MTLAFTSSRAELYLPPGSNNQSLESAQNASTLENTENTANPANPALPKQGHTSPWLAVLPGQTPWNKLLKVPLIAAVVVVFIGFAFAWPLRTESIHNIPVSVVGEPVAVAQFEQQLQAQGQGELFDVTPATFREQAIAQIEQRETYGSIILGEQGVAEVLTAPAMTATEVVSPAGLSTL